MLHISHIFLYGVYLFLNDQKCINSLINNLIFKRYRYFKKLKNILIKAHKIKSYIINLRKTNIHSNSVIWNSLNYISNKIATKYIVKS